MIGRGAFAVAREMFAKINAIMLLPTADRQEAFSLVGPYVSRGHGEGLLGNKHSRHTVAQDKRAARKARNKRR